VTTKCRYGLKCRNKDTGCKFLHEAEDDQKDTTVTTAANQQTDPNTNSAHTENKTEVNEATASTAAQADVSSS